MRRGAARAATGAHRPWRSARGSRAAAPADRDNVRRHARWRAGPASGGGAMSEPVAAAPLHGSARYERLLEAARALPPVTTAVAHPCDEVSIAGVVEATRLGLITPLLVGPPARLRA